VQAALEQARSLMRSDHLVLEAEAVLARLLAHLREAPSGLDGAAASRAARAAPVFQKVAQRVQQYESLESLLAPAAPGGADGDAVGLTYTTLWDKADARLLIHAQPGATWFEYKTIAYLDGSLGDIWVSLNETDLQVKYQKMLLGPPNILGERTRHLMVTQTFVRLLMLKIEIIIEIMRYVNKGFGFLAECIRPDSAEGVPIPAKGWSTVRVGARTDQLALPCGGGKRGTVVIQRTRVDAGLRIPEFVLNAFCTRLSQDWLENLRNCVKQAQTEGTPWYLRHLKDSTGFYAELAEAEQAASRRAAYSVSNLPTREIFERPWRLRHFEEPAEAA